VVLRALLREAAKDDTCDTARACGDFGSYGADRDTRGEIGENDKYRLKLPDRRWSQRIAGCEIERRSIATASSSSSFLSPPPHTGPTA
jgi:hypothetical protein